ncbi:MAG: monovalent cation/H+ antiporter subunit D family protein [Zhongshania sp.]|nr:monovalent cation/H+ antiporter subunit D family protein [Zhongshania sp.]
MDTTTVLIDVAILTPIIAVIGILAFSKKPNLREAISLIAGVTLLVINLKLYSSFNHGEALSRQWLEILPGLNLSFRVDALGLLFGLVASLLWPVTTLYAIGYMRGHNEDYQTRFYACFATAIAAVMAIAYAENLFTLFIFYEVLSLCTYPLVTHAGTEKAKKGGRVYLGILMGTSIAFFLPAIIITWLVAGTLDFQQGGIFPEQTPIALLSLLLVLFVFGVAKAAVMPFHRWLPAAMVAPTPVSALLHAVAVVKAGVFSLIKILVFIFGLDTLQQIPVSDYLLYLAGAGVVLASLIALRQDNLKARLAYSTISQLGYITLGTLLAVESGVMGSAMHIATHALGKITLFFCAGAILVASHKSEISSMAGLGRIMPITMAAFFIASLSIIGLPPTAGTWSKWWLLTATLETDHLILMAVLILSSLLNIAYLLPIPLRAFFPSKQAVAGLVTIHEAPPAALLAICSTASACVLLFFFPNPLFELVSQIFSEGRP